MAHPALSLRCSQLLCRQTKPVSKLSLPQLHHARSLSSFDNHPSKSAIVPSDSAIHRVNKPVRGLRNDEDDVPAYEKAPNWILPVRREGRTLRCRATGQPMRIVPPPPSARERCREPIITTNQALIAELDPTGARTRLFSRDNPEAIQVRDIVMVRQRDGDPFAGVVIRIKRAAAATAILLRNTITGVGVEMDFKIYSPNVTGIELVQRRTKAPKQHRLYYMRQRKHDFGSVDNIVRQYQRTKTAMASGRIILGSMQRPTKKGKKK